MARNYSNVAVATTVENSGGLSSGTTSLVLGSTTGMPAAPFTMRIRPETVNEELVTVTGGLGTLATPYVIVRGVDGTSAKSHPQASTIVHSVSARDFAEPQAHIDNVTPGSPHGLPVSAWQVQSVVAKTTDQGYSNDVTVNDDNQLRFTADANSSYRVELNLMATGTDGNITVGWRGPTGVGGTKMVQGPNIAATNLSNTSIRITCHPFSTPVGYGLAGGTVQAYIVEKMIVTTGSNSGEVVIQHCQNTTSASATTVKAGSYMVVTKLL